MITPIVYDINELPSIKYSNFFEKPIIDHKTNYTLYRVSHRESKYHRAISPVFNRDDQIMFFSLIIVW